MRRNHTPSHPSAGLQFFCAQSTFPLVNTRNLIRGNWYRRHQKIINQLNFPSPVNSTKPESYSFTYAEKELMYLSLFIVFVDRS
jgi:hypothetical protein